jgi:lantibiotic modifying enzyme
VTLRGRATSGFAHGAAGIVHALGALYRAGGGSAFLRAAEGGLHFERTLFVPEHGLWLEHHGVSRDAPDTVWCSWCHGAPGIALARASLLDVPGARGELEAGVAAILAQRMHPSDHLCCGTMGRVEALLVAAGALGRDDLRGEALARVSEVVARARRNRGFSVGIPEAFAPGFLQGQAGIGYGLLRLLDPRSVPCALTWT